MKAISSSLQLSTALGTNRDCHMLCVLNRWLLSSMANNINGASNLSSLFNGYCGMVHLMSCDWISIYWNFCCHSIVVFDWEQQTWLSHCTCYIAHINLELFLWSFYFITIFWAYNAEIDLLLYPCLVLLIAIGDSFISSILQFCK